MGLDMFLFKVKREEVAYWRKANAIHAWFGRKLGNYDEIENCRDYPVTKEDLIELRDVCKEVLSKCKTRKGNVYCGQRMTSNKWENIYEEGEVIQNPEIAEELLPSQEGFFFGSTDYDEHYLETLRSTIEQIDEILKTTDFEKEEIVYSAWW